MQNLCILHPAHVADEGGTAEENLQEPLDY